MFAIYKIFTFLLVAILLVDSSQQYDNFRLPTSLRPESYKLRIITFLEDPNNLTFAGDVLIKLNVLHDANNITLHAKNLNIDSTNIRVDNLNATNEDNAIMAMEVDPKNDYLILFVKKTLKKGMVYELFIPFEAPLNNRLKGYYKSSYKDKDTNQIRWLAVTQFEPASARAAFPCFDEPAYKAKFTVILGHKTNYTAISNMPLKSQTPFSNNNEWMWSEFEESVIMSTYLVAYTVNDFAYVTSKMNLQNKVQFRTWSRRDAIDQCHYASIIGPQILQYYEEIFNIKFPLAKVDQIAIPDFSAGAMENWGLVTYRETALLYADNVSSLASKQQVASIIAHELAHQWFGNLVTMKWWTDIWLNEGFATYIASLGVEKISPEWQLLDRESIDNVLTVFKLDALESSHPVSQPINEVSKIFEIFDTISYKKGSSVLRMMHRFLGDEAFHMGVSKYLSKHAYNNAEQDDLWQALTETAYRYNTLSNGLSVKTIMDSWTLQTGYPILYVRRNYDTRTALISQARYLLNANVSRTQNSPCWWIPITYTTQSEHDFQTLKTREWLQCSENRQELPLTLEVANSTDWLILNVQISGLYRVNYDKRNWQLLIDALLSKHFQHIHTLNRAQLIDDALNLAWSGDQSYDVAFALLEYLYDEREYIPWKTALDNLSTLNRLIWRSTEYVQFENFMRKILKPMYYHLGGLNTTSISGEKSTHIMHKSLIAAWACRFEIDDCVAKAREYFGEWRATSNPDESNPVPADFRSPIYCAAIRYGDNDDWQFLWMRYKNSNVASEKRIIISALGCSRNSTLLKGFLEDAFSNSSNIRRQDTTLTYGAIAHGEVGFPLAKEFFLKNIQFLHDYFEPDTSDFSRLLAPLSGQISDRSEYDEMKLFVEENWPLLKSSEMAVRRFLETVQINTMWKERSFTDILHRLRI